MAGEGSIAHWTHQVLTVLMHIDSNFYSDRFNGCFVDTTREWIAGQFYASSPPGMQFYVSQYIQV